MGGCPVPCYNNLAAKEYTMKRFLRNSERQTVWVKNINRENWIPTNNSLLCEVNTFEFFTIR